MNPLTTSNFSTFSALKFLLFILSDSLIELISWTKPQVQARSHPNVLAAIVWLNNLYHIQVTDKSNSEKNRKLAKTLEGVDLNIPLAYADRFRIRKPGRWDESPNIHPHVDGACQTLLARLFLIHARRRNYREMGRSVFQEVFREYFKRQLERS